MSNPVDLIKEDIASAKEQLDIDVKKVSLLQQEIKQIQEQAQTAINEKQTQINAITQPILENQGYIKRQTEFLNKLEGNIEVTSEK